MSEDIIQQALDVAEEAWQQEREPCGKCYTCRQNAATIQALARTGEPEQWLPLTNIVMTFNSLEKPGEILMRWIIVLRRKGGDELRAEIVEDEDQVIPED